jgi:hypothetical protein
MDGWMDGWMNEIINEQQSLKHLFYLILNAYRKKI